MDSIPCSGWAGFAVRRAFTEPEPDIECCAVLARVDSMGSSDTGLGCEDPGIGLRGANPPDNQRASSAFDALYEALAESNSPDEPACANSLTTSLRAAARVAAAEAEA